ncbi:MAG: CDP-alcohol phosphatidyltransferase family protein [Candidatus Dormibacteraceae bacterium]
MRDLRHSAADPRAWWGFTAHSCRRSLEQWRAHPHAARSVLAAHLGLFLATRKRWVLLSLAYCATHLGLLGDEDRLSPADLVTLARANLPALAPRSRWSAPAAVLSDALDGWLARRTQRTTAFGAYLDGLADVVFWTWFATARDPVMAVRILGLAFWALPAAGITAAYFVTGRSIDYPRLSVVRRASAAIQVALAVRAVIRITTRRTPGGGSWRRPAPLSRRSLD